MSGDARRTRVLRVLAAAARVATPTDALGRVARRRLPGASGLSVEGVELALARHLEHAAAPRELDALLACGSSAARCWVVASANVCTAAARAIALAVATAPDVRVRPSRRDPVIAELLVEALRADAAFAAAGGTIALESELAAVRGDEVHAYGSDATMAALAAELPAAVTFRAHGTGLGVGVVGASADLVRAAEAIAADVVAFDQRGCLSPRVVFVEGDAARGALLVDLLDRALDRWEALVPRGVLDDATAAELVQWSATATAIGQLARGRAHLVALVDRARALAPAPAARALCVVPADAAEATRLLAPIAPHVAALGADRPCSPVASALQVLAPGARRSALGAMQRPPLDGPVDLRARSVR